VERAAQERVEEAVAEVRGVLRHGLVVGGGGNGLGELHERDTGREGELGEVAAHAQELGAEGVEMGEAVRQGGHGGDPPGRWKEGRREGLTVSEGTVRWG
jgi:hypothetical protein